MDFCKDPEKVCTDATRTMGMRWTVALFEWIDRVQSYDDVDTVDVDDYDDGGDGDGVVLGRRRWNYIDRLHSFAHTNDVIKSVQSSFLVGTPPHFIDMVGGILEQGCPYPPCVEDDDDGSRPNRLRFRSERKRAFVDALGGVGLPIRGEAYRAMEAHFKGGGGRGDTAQLRGGPAAVVVVVHVVVVLFLFRDRRQLVLDAAVDAL